MKYVRCGRAALLCLILLSVFSACTDAEDAARAHRERAVAHVASGEYELARVEAANLLKLDPRNVDDLVLSAAIARALGDVRRAATLLLSAHEIDPDHADARVSLAQLRVLARQHQEALALLAPVLAANADHAQALALRAAARFSIGNRTDARADLDRALALQPANGVALPLKSALLLAEQGPDAAIALLENVLDTAPERKDLRTLLVRLLLDADRYSAAADQLGRMIERGDSRQELSAHRANLLLKAGHVEQGEQILRDGIATLSEASTLKLALVRFLANDGRRDQAMQTLDAFILGDARAFDLRLAQASMLASAGMEEEARSAYRQILADQPSLNWQTQAVVALADFEQAQGRTDAALATVDAFLTDEANSAAALAMRARLRLDVGDLEGAVGDLHAALASDRDNLDLRYDLAQLHTVRGDLVLAEVQLRQALEQTPGFHKARIALVKLHMEQGQLHESRREVEELLVMTPHSVDALSLAFDVARRGGDWDQASDYAQRIKSQHPDRSLGPFLASVAYLGQSDAVSAERELATALAIDPVAKEPLTAMVRLLLASDRRADAERRLDDTLAIDPGHPTALQWRAQLHLAAERPRRAIPMFEKALATRSTIVDAWRGLAASHLRLGDRDAARRALEQGIAAVPVEKQEQLSVDLTLLHLSRDDALAAVAEAERYLRENPASLVTMNNLAMMLVEHAPYDNSLARARVLVGALVPSGDENYVDTYAMVMTRTGNATAAIEAIDLYLKREKPSAKLRYRRGIALTQQGKHDSAARELRAALRSAPTSPFAEDARERLRQLP